MTDKPNPDFFLISRSKNGYMLTLRVNGQLSHEEQHSTPLLGRDLTLTRTTLENIVIQFGIYTLKRDGSIGARVRLVNGKARKYLRSNTEKIEADDLNDVAVDLAVD